MEHREAEQGILGFLKAKGYTLSVTALKTESRVSTFPESCAKIEHIFSASMNATVPSNYFQNYEHLKGWVLKTLEKYRTDLQRLLYPAFTYLYLEMVKHNLPEAEDFFGRFSSDHAHTEDIRVLATLTSLRKLESEAGRLFLENSVKLKISKYALQLLMSFIESEGFSLMYWIVTKYIDFDLTSEAAGTKAALLDKEGRDVKNLDHVNLLGYSEDGKQRKDAKAWVPRLPLATEKRREEDEQERMGLSEDQPHSICFHTVHHAAESLLCADVSEEGKMLVCGFEDSLIRLWDLTLPVVASRKTIFEEDEESEFRLFSGHSGAVFAVRFSPCSRLFISGSEDGSIRLWSLISMSNVAVLKGHIFSVWTLGFNLQGYFFASGGADYTARLWSSDSTQAVRVFSGHFSDVIAVKFHPASAYLATASSDKTVRMWDISSAQCVRLLCGHCVSVTALEFTYAGKTLLSGDDSGLVCAWDVQESAVLWEKQFLGSITGLCVSHEDALLSVASESNRLWLLSPKTGALVSDSPTKHTPVLTATFTWRNLLLAAGPYRGPA